MFGRLRKGSLTNSSYGVLRRSTEFNQQQHQNQNQEQTGLQICVTRLKGLNHASLIRFNLYCKYDLTVKLTQYEYKKNKNRQTKVFGHSEALRRVKGSEKNLSLHMFICLDNVESSIKTTTTVVAHAFTFSNSSNPNSPAPLLNNGSDQLYEFDLQLDLYHSVVGESFFSKLATTSDVFLGRVNQRLILNRGEITLFEDIPLSRTNGTGTISFTVTAHNCGKRNTLQTPSPKRLIADHIFDADNVSEHSCTTEDTSSPSPTNNQRISSLLNLKTSSIRSDSSSTSLYDQPGAEEDSTVKGTVKSGSGVKSPRYSVLNKLGKGGMGSVFTAIDTKSAKDMPNRVVALKKITCHSVYEANRAMSEFWPIRKLRHPNLVEIEDIFFEEGDKGDAKLFTLCLVMELFSEGDLLKQLQKRELTSDYMSEENIRSYMKQLAAAVVYLHQSSLLHRDLKPANLFLQNEGQVLKIGDFGLVRELSSDSGNETSGTIRYMAPEIFSERKYDEKADIWSLGVIMYEMMTLRTNNTLSVSIFSPDFFSNLSKELNGRYSDDLLVVLSRILEKEAKLRLTAQALLALLNEQEQKLQHNPVLPVEEITKAEDNETTHPITTLEIETVTPEEAFVVRDTIETKGDEISVQQIPSSETECAEIPSPQSLNFNKVDSPGNLIEELYTQSLSDSQTSIASSSSTESIPPIEEQPPKETPTTVHEKEDCEFKEVISPPETDKQTENLFTKILNKSNSVPSTILDKFETPSPKRNVRRSLQLSSKKSVVKPDKQTMVAEEIKRIQHTPLPKQYITTQLRLARTIERADSFVKTISPSEELPKQEGQWVSKVLAFSSEYQDEVFGNQLASNLVGKPSVYPNYEESDKTWAPMKCKSTSGEFLELEFAKPCFISEILVYETHNPGYVQKIRILNLETRKWHLVYQKQEHRDRVTNPKQARIFRPKIRRPDFASNIIRVEFKTSECRSWINIDAVQICGEYSKRGTSDSDSEILESVEQWVHKVNAYSSEHASRYGSWLATNIVGPPVVYPDCGDDSRTWAPMKRRSSLEYIELIYEHPVIIDSVGGISIYETLTPGSVVKIQCWNPDGQDWDTIYLGTAHQETVPTRNSRIFSPDLKAKQYPTNLIRIELDTRKNISWTNIDAVKLRGYKTTHDHREKLLSTGKFGAESGQ